MDGFTDLPEILVLVQPLLVQAQGPWTPPKISPSVKKRHTLQGCIQPLTLAFKYNFSPLLFNFQQP